MEKKRSEMLKGIRAWAKFRDFDRRNMVGRYSALIYRVADDKPLNEPLETTTTLVDLVPLYEDQIKVTAWVIDANSDQYGKPAMFKYRTAAIPTLATSCKAAEGTRTARPAPLLNAAIGSLSTSCLVQAAVRPRCSTCRSEIWTFPPGQCFSAT